MYSVLAWIDRGVDSAWICHPDADSPEKGTVASRVPLEDQIWPVCVPVSFEAFQKRIAEICPAAADWNFIPSSYETPAPSLTLTFCGTWVVRTVSCSALALKVTLPTPVADACTESRPALDPSVRLVEAVPLEPVTAEAGLTEPPPAVTVKLTVVP